jgi:hypothetical protein
MSPKSKVVHEGVLYYSVPLVARLLGVSTRKVRALIVEEGLEWANFRVNGPIYISADSVTEYESRCEAP